MNLNQLVETGTVRLENLFQLYLKTASCPAPLLQKAMAYAVLNGGKRLRPLLVYTVGRTLGASWDNLDLPACAVELIHAYSLVHDDLPAMDNADLRRGKPSCHNAFTEALAILAGDALQPLAFTIIASHPSTLSVEQRVHMLQVLCEASGLTGMAGGQTLDITGTHDLLTMYQLKTGALITASAKLGAIAANANNDLILPHIEKYANNLGLIFQLQDDLLDAENSAITGKPQGLDQANNKITYPTLFGIAKTKEKIAELSASLSTTLNALGEQSKPLQAFADFLLRRDN